MCYGNKPQHIIECTLDGGTCDFQLLHLLDFDQTLLIYFSYICECTFKVCKVFLQDAFAFFSKKNIDISICYESFDFQFAFDFVLSRYFEEDTGCLKTNQIGTIKDQLIQTCGSIHTLLGTKLHRVILARISTKISPRNDGGSLFEVFVVEGTSTDLWQTSGNCFPLAFTRNLNVIASIDHDAIVL